MRSLLAITLLVALSACAPPRIPVPHKYGYGEKVLLKTGEQAVVVEYPYFNRTTLEGYPKIPEYIVRVALMKRINQTDSLLEGRQTRQTDIGKFLVYEHEIEKSLDK